MPVYVDIVSRLDERSAEASARQIERQFGGVGQSVADQLERQFGDVGKSINAGLSTHMAAVGRAATGMGTSVAGGAAVAVTALAGIAVAAVKVGDALYDIGARFDDVADSIAVRTGKVGDDLDALTRSISNVSIKTASSIEEIADIGARVSQAFSLSGAPLEDLTKRIADLNRMTGESLNVREFGMALRGFGEGGDRAAQVLNELKSATDVTGIPLNELVGTLGDIGPAARSLGLDMNQTAGLIVTFEKAGIDASKTVQGLSRAAMTFSDNNIDLKTGLADTITQISGFIDAGNEAAAIDLAGKVFGNRAAQTFVDSIRQGTLSVDTLRGGLGTTGDTIGDLNDKTSDWAEQWTILKNRVSDVANEIGGPLFDMLNKALGVLNDILAPPPQPPVFAPPLPGLANPLTAPYLGGVAPDQTPTGNPLDALFPTVPGGAYPPAPPVAPQDIAGALADAENTGGPKLPATPVLPYDTSLPPGIPGMPPDASVFGAESSFLDARHNLAEKRARLTQLEQSSEATAEDVLNARNDVLAQERDFQAAEMRLTDARNRQYEQMVKAGETQAKKLQGLANDLGQVGAALDADFGISKGLAGIAENVTKFVANLAAAPLIGSMRGRQAASGYSPGETGGGLVGVMAQQGVFGSQYQVQPSWARNQQQYATSGYGPSALGPAALQPGGYPGDAALLANVPAGRYTQEARGDLTQGLADCSSAVEDLVNLMDGRPTAGATMSTGNAAEWLTSRGFMPGAGSPGDFRVGFNSGHMQATLPGGTPFNWGSAASAARGGVGGTGASDPAFTSHFYRPAGGGAGGSGGGGYVPLTQSELTSPGLTSPQPVGGGMGTGGAFPGLGGPPQAFNSTLGIPTPGGGPGTGPTLIGGAAAPVGKGSGFGGASGGLFGLAASAAKSAMAAGGMAGDAMGGGGGGSAGAAIASAAMDIGIQEINRAIGYAGQVAGIGVGGLMETFLPAGASELASNSWITRLAGGLVGARPVLPNLAGGNTAEGLTPEQQAQQQGQAGPLSPEQASAHQASMTGGQQKAGDTNITVNNQRATEDGTGRDIAYLQRQTNAGPGM